MKLALAWFAAALMFGLGYLMGSLKAVAEFEMVVRDRSFLIRYANMKMLDKEKEGRFKCDWFDRDGYWYNVKRF